MKEIFLFISSTKTKVSKTVSLLTRSKITHSALCLNGKFDKMYSFGRKTLKPFPAGFVYENVRERMLKVQNKCNCMVFRIEIDEEQYQSLLEEIEKYEKEKNKFRYAIIGVWFCLFRIKKTFKYRRFCSQFVANLLHDGAKLPLPYHTSLMRPKDFLTLDYIEKVYEGRIVDLQNGIDDGSLNFKKFQ